MTPNDPAEYYVLVTAEEGFPVHYGITGPFTEAEAAELARVSPRRIIARKVQMPPEPARAADQVTAQAKRRRTEVWNLHLAGWLSRETWLLAEGDIERQRSARLGWLSSDPGQPSK